MFLDHITVAVPDLAIPLAKLGSVGLHAEYGGVHSNGITHMALISFANGSYLEVVAPVNPSGRVALWHDYLLPYAGGTAWTVGVADVEQELIRAESLGIAGAGPVTIKRTKPNGMIGSWDLGYFRSKQPGGTLPFLIHDDTPREVRVPPSTAPHIPLGWSSILLACLDTNKSAISFQQLYGWKQYRCEKGLTYFPDTPVYLASPPEHLQDFGESPYAAILSVTQDAAKEMKFSHLSDIAGRKIYWLDLAWPQLQIGVEIIYDA